MTKASEATKRWREKFKAEDPEGYRLYRKNEHSKRYSANKELINQQSTEWAKNNRDAVNAAKRIRRRKLTPEGRTVSSVESRKWQTNNPDKVKATKRRIRLRSIGWSEERFNRTVDEQSGACAICREAFRHTPHCDHEHVDPPKPRGLLCTTCNTGLGQFKDNPMLLEAATAYLRKWGK